MEMTDEERAETRGLFLLTMKPILYVANVDEDQLGEELAPIDGVTPIPICAKVEAELSELEPEEAVEYLADLGLEKSGLETLAQAAYRLLGLQSYFTAGEMEVKAWTVRVGAKAPEAAGVIRRPGRRRHALPVQRVGPGARLSVPRANSDFCTSAPSFSAGEKDGATCLPACM